MGRLLVLLVASQQRSPTSPGAGSCMPWCWEPYAVVLGAVCRGAGSCMSWWWEPYGHHKMPNPGFFFVASTSQRRRAALADGELGNAWIFLSVQRSPSPGGRGMERGPGSAHPTLITSLGAQGLLPASQKPGKCLNFPGCADCRAQVQPDLRSTRLVLTHAYGWDGTGQDRMGWDGMEQDGMG